MIARWLCSLLLFSRPTAPHTRNDSSLEVLSCWREWNGPLGWKELAQKKKKKEKKLKLTKVKRSSKAIYQGMNHLFCLLLPYKTIKFSHLVRYFGVNEVAGKLKRPKLKSKKYLLCSLLMEDVAVGRVASWQRVLNLALHPSNSACERTHMHV